MEYISSKEKDTLELAKKLAECLCGGEVILLNGDLGAGKTVFAKGIALGLGITDRVVSPTFTIMNEYKGRLMMYHFDMYRLDDEESELGFEEYFGKEDSVCVIEWNVFANIKSTKIITVDITYIDEHTRRIAIDENFVC